MEFLKLTVAAAFVAVPLLASMAPAQALTAHQYQAQGHGRYVSSKKRVGGMGYRHWHRHRHYHHHRRMY